MIFRLATFTSVENSKKSLIDGFLKITIDKRTVAGQWQNLDKTALDERFVFHETPSKF